jgi:hypothetical protein
VRALVAAHDWWLGRAPLHGLVAARILLGGALFLTYARRSFYAGELFGPAGFAGAEFYRRLPAAPPLNPNVGEPATLLRFVPSETAIVGLCALAALCALAFALGFRTRLAGAATLALHFLFYARNPFVYEGSWAEFVHGPLLYTLLAPVGTKLSVDAWLRARRARASGADEETDAADSWLGPAWPLRLFQIHVCCMYVAAAWSRLDKESWLAGEILYLAVSGATHGRFAFDWSALRPLLTLGAWGALALEVVAPVLLWVPRIGVAVGIGLVALHLGIELLTNVGWWNAVMIAGVLTFLLPSHAQACTSNVTISPRRGSGRRVVSRTK